MCSSAMVRNVKFQLKYRERIFSHSQTSKFDKKNNKIVNNVNKVKEASKYSRIILSSI